MTLDDPLLQHIFQRLVASIGTGALFLGLVWLILAVFKVRNPAIRYAFLVIPLVKSAVALMLDTPRLNGRFMIMVQMPNFGIIPDMPNDMANAGVPPSFVWLRAPTLMLTTVIALLFCWRLYALWSFHRKIRDAEELTGESHPDVYAMAERLAAQAGVGLPSLVMIGCEAAPFTVGVRRPVIVLSPALIEHLTEEELSAAMAHEIAHIARRDYIYHWPIILLRDVLFFSPFSRIIYRLLGFEKERACDRFGAGLIDNQTLPLAKSLVHIAELRVAQPALGLGQGFAPQNLLDKKQSFFSRRVKELVEPSSFTRMSVWRWAGLLPVLILLLVIDVRVGVRLLGSLFFLA